MRYFKIFIIYGVVLLSASCGEEKKKQENQPNREREVENDLVNVSLEQVWATDTIQLFTPECATYYPEQDVFYVSNLNRDNKIDNDGYISIISADGDVKNARWVEGLTSPLGNDFYNGHLYVNDKSHIVKIDIENGDIVEKINIEGAVGLNGMDIDNNGDIYVADDEGNKIFKITQDGKISVIFEGAKLNNPNGVLIKDDVLIVASSGSNSLKSIDLESNQIQTLAEGIGHADGIIPLEGGGYLISSWTGKVFYISNDMIKQKILDTSSKKINAADIGYIPEEKLLVVPTFYDNRLVAYKLNIDGVSE